MALLSGSTVKVMPLTHKIIKSYGMGQSLEWLAMGGSVIGAILATLLQLGQLLSASAEFSVASGCRCCCCCCSRVFQFPAPTRSAEKCLYMRKATWLFLPFPFFPISSSLLVNHCFRHLPARQLPLLSW